ncbi:hypothetical protein [Flavobacterium ginsengiterrae]|uniref:Uncharacterized protein n=1 Tax=Flavobacterium ginsengiterrae TaxID=871695 RepID=A0ABP7GSM5_9FLAO
MKKIKFTIFALLIGFSVQSQSLNPTQKIISPGTADSFTGGYTFSYSTAGTPWNGALISFGGFDNRYDCQISADYGVNGGNSISFRTRNGDVNNGVGVWNSWNELATRGVNNFVGNQIISGNVGIGTLNPNSRLDLGPGYGIKGAKLLIYNDDTTSELSGTKCGFYMDNFGYNNLNLVFPEAASHAGLFTISAKNTSDVVLKPYFSITGLTGNVGIGTTKPDSKLTVAGNIHAREVKVTVNAGAVPDYVFADDYKLKTLNEVEVYIKENKHLPEIPSAKEIEKNGLMMAEMNMNLLKKIEELTLYIIQIKKQNEKDNMKQNEEIENLKMMLELKRNKEK